MSMFWITHRYPLAIAVVLLALSQAVGAEEILTGKCVSVIDGDTIKILHEGRELTVRLEGIDAPESGDDYSNKAKRFASGLVFGKTVTVRVKELDRYGRTVGRVILGDKDVSLALVQAGLAWHYTQYSSDPKLAEAEALARSAEINIWSLPNPLPPWERENLRASAQDSANAAATRTDQALVYHGNRQSRVFHAPWCRYYSCKNCTVVFQSRDAAIQAGYRPGGHCNP